MSMAIATSDKTVHVFADLSSLSLQFAKSFEVECFTDNIGLHEQYVHWLHHKNFPLDEAEKNMKHIGR